MRVPRRRAAAVAIATAAAIVMTAGTASAYWNTSGSGAGVARAGAAGVLLVEPGTASSALAPGGISDVTAVIKNSADYPVLVTSVATPAAGIPGYEDAGLARPVSSCDATHSGVTVKQSTPRSASFVIAARGTYTVTLSEAVTMSNDSDTSCQGLFFAVPVTVTAASAAGSTPTLPAVGTL